jgi:hypothetical protein
MNWWGGENRQTNETSKNESVDRVQLIDLGHQTNSAASCACWRRGSISWSCDVREWHCASKLELTVQPEQQEQEQEWADWYDMEDT